MEKQNYCNLYLVRHGETEWNVKNIIQGQSNSNLTEKGIEQAMKTGDELRDIKFDAIFSSDSTRAHNTAEIIKLDRELIIETSHLLRERNFGSFEGRHASEFLEAFREKLKEKETLSGEEGWNFTVASDIETDEMIVSRFITKLREIAVAYPNQTVLVVSHGGPIRMFLAKIGYAKREELVGGSLKNAGCVNVLSDGVDFILQSVKGVELSK
ncbi:MAG: histidine phosphatase family protein [Candidatus Nomurabacteria bacterium]